MTVLNTSPLLLREVAADDDAYQIEKSIRLDSGDTAYLAKTLKAGNQRIFTWSGWIKRTKLANGTFYSSAQSSGSNPRTDFQFTNDQLYVGFNPTGSSWKEFKTSRYFRDCSAWYHIVIAVDTTQAVNTQRVKIYVNGRRESTFDDYATIDQYTETTMNSGEEHSIGRYENSDNNYSNILISNLEFIDGFQLSPAAFGSFDSLGVWNPKAFALPAPNQNYTYSTGSNFSVTNGGGYDPITNPANMFDGSLSTYANQPWGGSSVTYTFPTEIDVTTEITLHTANLRRYEINPGESDASGLLPGDAGTIHIKRPTSGKLKKLKLETNAGTQFQIKGVEVDGVLLVDGITDSAVRYNSPNNGTTWSDGWSGDFFGNWTGVKCFDGKYLGVFVADEATRPDTGDTVTWTAPHSISFTKLELQGMTDGGTIKVNDTDVGTAVNGAWPKWHDITSSISSPLTEIKLTSIGTGRPVLTGVRVDGHVLIDSHNDNSFHLKFNDLSLNSRLGKDTLNGKIEDATGGLPILKTKAGTNDNDIDYGDVKDTGTRADSDSANLLLAVPFDSVGATDYHATIKGSGTNRTFSNLSTAYATTTDSRFYGASANMDVGANRAVKTSTNASDFEFGTGDFTIEWWAKYPDATSSNGYIASFQKDDFSGNPYPLYIYRASNNNTQVWSSSSVGDKTAWPSSPLGSWNHYALVRSGSGTTWKTYLDGALQESWTTTAYDISTVDQLVIGDYEDGVLPLDGFIQDFRVYNKAKYTGDFKTPTRNDFTVNNLIHGTSTGVTTGGAWSTAFKDGSATSYNGADDWVISSGSSASTNGNSNRIYIDTGALGDAYELTCTDTGGANDIYFAHQNSDNPGTTSGWDLVENNNTKIVFTAGGANCDGTTVSHKRYVRLEGAGSGHVTITITGVLGLDEGTSASAPDIDSLVDSPTVYGEDTGAGGEVRGNYPTFNPLQKHSSLTLSQGNLEVESTSNTHMAVMCTMAIPQSGKWYFEATDGSGDSDMGIGVKASNTPHADMIDNFKGTAINFVRGNGYKYTGGTDYGETEWSGFSGYSEGDTVGIAIDMDNGAWYTRKPDGTWTDSGDPTSGSSKTGATFTDMLSKLPAGASWIPSMKLYNGSGHIINFGQRPFVLGSGAPTDYKCLCTQNLPDTFSGDELNNPSKYFDVKTWAGTGASNAIKGLGFQPDLLWLKSRSAAGYDHTLFDAARGVNKGIYTNGDWAEDNYSVHHNQTSFDSNGWTMGAASNAADILNETGGSYVGFAWDAGTAVTNYGASDNGADIACAVWKNTTAGFSIVKWTSDAGNSNSFMNHGLGTHLDFVIIKNLTTASSWIVLHDGLGTDTNSIRENHLVLDTTGAMVDKGNEYFERASNVVFGLRHDIISSSSSDEMIAYCWAAIPGFSQFGQYEGTGTADGPFIYTGFKPKWLLLKCADGHNWVLKDTTRNPYNPSNGSLLADGNQAETDWNIHVDILSNGFKLKGASESNSNKSGENHIYSAFAELPFKLSRAR